MKTTASILAIMGLVAQPAFAGGIERGADLTEQPQRAAFAGPRISMPSGGKDKNVRGGLALSSTQRNAAGGALNFSKGLELGFAGDNKVRLSVGGQSFSSLSNLASGSKQAPQGQRAGISTIGWIGIAAGVALVGVLLVANALNSCEDHDDEC